METQEQKEQLSSWAKKRDELLASISILKVENEKLTQANKELANSSKDIEIRINESNGRLDELNKREKEYEEIVSNEVKELTSKKSMLQAENTALEKEQILLKSGNDFIKENISSLTGIYEKLFTRSIELDKTIGEGLRVNTENISQIRSLLGTVKSSVQALWDINKINTEKANFMITELPRMFIELQRRVLDRKTKHDLPSQ